MIDIRVENHGTICLFIPLTPAARTFLDECVQSEPWQWLGFNLAVEPRYALDLANGAIEHGLEVSFDN